MDSQTYERGRFYIGPNGFPRFAGSASGVYLADTVQTEIGPSPRDVPSEGIEEAFIYRNHYEEPRATEAQYYNQYSLKVTDLLASDRLRTRLNSYFTLWHPLFPFLDGAYLLQCFSNAVSLATQNTTATNAGMQGQGMGTGSGGDRCAFEGLKAEEALVLSAIMMAVFTIGVEDGRINDAGLPLYRGASHATMVAHLIVGACQNSKINDLFAIQGLIAIELYLYTTRTLRPAMHLSGTVSKLAYEAGLHRCPSRYSTTFKTANDRDIRRRVFYSLYVLDRILSAEFGLPIMMNDSDIDTCLPGGEEKHIQGDSPPDHPARSPVTVVSVDTPQSKRRRVEDSTQAPQSTGPNSRDIAKSVDSAATETRTQAEVVEQETARRRLLPAFSLIGITRLMGKAMEAFNKSVKHRTLDAQNSLQLRIDLESWWNELGFDCADEDEVQLQSDPRHRFSTLFTCLYHQQNIALHRSALSLAPTSAQHAYALQTTIASARLICATLAKAFLDKGIGQEGRAEEIHWPGYADMLFFSCLILVYGEKRDREMGLGSVSSPRLHRDLQRAARVLEALSVKWDSLKSFIRVVQAFIKRINLDSGVSSSGGVFPAAAGAENAPANIPAFTIPAADAFPSYPSFDDFGVGNFGGVPSDFTFNFDGLFELNPDTQWAFHQSLPGSPAFPQQFGNNA